MTDLDDRWNGEFPKEGLEQTDNQNCNGNSYGSNAEILVNLAQENCEQFFKDEYGNTFAVANIVDHKEVINLESSKFKHFLSKLFYDKNNHKVAGSDAINNTIQVLQAKAEHEGKTIPLSLRVAWSKDKDEIYYDLTDQKWRCVKITKSGWNMVDDSPILFTRFNQTPQVEPSAMHDSNIFDRFLNLANITNRSDRLLLKVYIISLIIPDIPHVMLQLHGEKGSTKSTLQTFIKKIIDPSKPTLLTIYNDKTEFIQQVSHNYVLFYDNMKYIPGWLPDEVCKAITGSGMTKRKLYTNNEDMVYEYKRCMGFNGININLTEADALDRSILIELQRIRKENRQPESKILAEFDKMLPQLLSYSFETVSKALRIKEKVKLAEHPRMADFAFWGEVISQAMGHEPLEFHKSYYQNIGTQNIEAIEANPLAQAIVKLIDEYGNRNPDGVLEYSVSTKNFKEDLDKIAQKSTIDTESRLWPKSLSLLSRRIKEIKSNLIEGFGIEVSISRNSTTNTSIVTICKKPPTPPIRPEEKYQDEKLDNYTGGITTSGDVVSPDLLVPPRNLTKIDTQNGYCGRAGASGGVLGNTLDHEKENQNGKKADPN